MTGCGRSAGCRGFPVGGDGTVGQWGKQGADAGGCVVWPAHTVVRKSGDGFRKVCADVLGSAGEGLFATACVIGASLCGVGISAGADQEALSDEVLNFLELCDGVIAFEPCGEGVTGVGGDEECGLIGMGLGVEVSLYPGAFVIEAEEDFPLQILQSRPASFQHGVSDGGVCGLSQVCGDEPCCGREDFVDELVQFFESWCVPAHQPNSGWIRHGLLQFQQDHDWQVVWSCLGPLANLLEGLSQGGDIGGVVEAGGVENFDAGLTEAAIGVGVRSRILIAVGEQVAGERFGEEAAEGVCEQVEFQLSDLHLLQLLREGFVCVFDPLQDRCPCQLNEIGDSFVWSDVVAVMCADQLNLVESEVVETMILGECRDAAVQKNGQAKQRNQPETQASGDFGVAAGELA